VPKRRVGRGTHPRRLGAAARAHLRVVREVPESIELRNLPPTEVAHRREQVRFGDPHEPEFGDTVVLAVRMDCTSCPTEIEEGAEATYIDGELNCTECTEEARRG
jgi:hypothetical protein